MNFQNQDDTICALSTPAGMGAIALIRLSGTKTFEIVEQVFSKSVADKSSHTAHFGTIREGEELIDEVLLTVFKNPASFTGEDSIEIACHGSLYIQEKILALLINKGARLAGPGEFSLRAFLNGKMDLSQTEAVADLISASSKAAHQVAMHQMRGGFSEEINDLRQELMNFASLVELELDFSEEDVEFADRGQLVELVQKVARKTNALLDSFSLGNVIKNGIPVAIVGSPNAGKSTLLNTLLNEDRAIVSEIAGTTRDVIEDSIVLDGIEFRFVDTAGIRTTTDEIENLGIQRAYSQIKKARIVLLLIDVDKQRPEEIIASIESFRQESIQEDQTFIPLLNKVDTINQNDVKQLEGHGMFISAKHKINIDQLIAALTDTVKGYNQENQTIVTNVRHFEILQKCKLSLIKVAEGLEMQIPGDLLAMDIRETLQHLGEITGQITTDDLLGNIFANFCIGK
jgi:tRNA modification GTPase